MRRNKGSEPAPTAKEEAAPHHIDWHIYEDQLSDLTLRVKRLERQAYEDTEAMLSRLKTRLDEEVAEVVETVNVTMTGGPGGADSPDRAG